MITFLASGHAAEPIVEAALTRSAGTAVFAAQPAEPDMFIACAPADNMLDAFEALLARRTKLVIFGRTGPRIAARIGLSLADIGPKLAAASSCPPAPLHAFSESEARIRWLDHGLARHAPLESRALTRFDYASEWNNLGFGNIGAAGGLWDLACEATATAATPIAVLEGHDTSFGVMAALFETQTASVLWWNRPVGPVDSTEWTVVEAFLADWRPADRPCLPIIEDVPFGREAAVTMRLDCDEDIASARGVMALYAEHGLPFSLAVTTGRGISLQDRAMLAEVAAAGGALLSHSVTHAPNWGGTPQAAEQEAAQSKAWLEQHVPGAAIRHAVSPFHQNPPFVPAALARAGISGFIGGIAANDKHALLARGGVLPSDTSGVVTHSQQCMLHGDVMGASGDPLAIPREAYRIARRGRSFFGYLDHPQSVRYDYGWGSLAAQIAAHASFLDTIAPVTAGEAGVLFVNENDCLDWFVAKSRIALSGDGAGDFLRSGPVATLIGRFAIRYQGRRLPLADFARP